MAGSCLNTPVPVSADGGWMADWKRKGIFLALKSFFSWQSSLFAGCEGPGEENWLVWLTDGLRLGLHIHTHTHTQTLSFWYTGEVHPSFLSPPLFASNVCQLNLSSDGYNTSVSVKITLVLSYNLTSHHKSLTSEYVCLKKCRRCHCILHVNIWRGSRVWICTHMHTVSHWRPCLRF